MKSLRTHAAGMVASLAAAVWILTAGLGTAQTTPRPNPPDPAAHGQHSQHAPPPTAPSTDQAVDLAREIAALRAQVAELQAAMVQGHASGAAPQQPTMGRKMGGGMQSKVMGSGAAGAGAQPGSGGMQGMSGMGGMAGGSAMGGMQAMDSMEGGMGGMGSGSGGMGMMGMDMMGMMGSMRMGGMGSMAAASTPSALPGFPGASRLYHIGATGFFLDHPEHVTLTLEQQTMLNQKKERALLGQSDFARKIEQAEQDLWVMTGADQPDAAAIDQKAREIAKIQADQRIAFIHSVGDAATVLTDEQRRQLTGMLPPQHAPAGPAVPRGGAMSDGM